jgi:hypothetical protein
VALSRSPRGWFREFVSSQHAQFAFNNDCDCLSYVVKNRNQNGETRQRRRSGKNNDNFTGTKTQGMFSQLSNVASQDTLVRVPNS